MYIYTPIYIPISLFMFLHPLFFVIRSSPALPTRRGKTDSAPALSPLQRSVTHIYTSIYIGLTRRNIVLCMAYKRGDGRGSVYCVIVVQ